MKIIKQTIGLILAIIAASLIIVIFLNPPTDFDGGPMLGYNLLFFFPLVLLAGILSIISMIIAVTKLIRRKTEKKTIQIIALFLSALVFLYFLSVVIRVLTPVNYDYLDEYDIPEDKYNTSDSIKVTKNQTIYLVGYNWGSRKNQNNRRLYVSLKPYEKEEFNVTETYCFQGDSAMAIYYQAKLDSIFVYHLSNYGYYTFVNATELEKIPLRTVKLSKEGLDSLIVSDYGKKIRKFEWNEIKNDINVEN